MRYLILLLALVSQAFAQSPISPVAPQNIAPGSAITSTCTISNALLYNAATPCDSGLTYNSTTDVLTVTGASGAAIVAAGGTATTDVNALSVTQTWNAAGVTFEAVDVTITDTASAAGSLALRIRGGASGTTNLFAVTSLGELLISGASGTYLTSGGGFVNLVSTASAKAIRFSGASDHTTGVSLHLVEMTAPDAPSANNVRIYAQDNGAGKTQLCALFNTGVAQCFATEP